MKKTAFFLLISTQIIIAIYLYTIILKKQNNTLGANINVIKKDTLIFPNTNSSLLQNFYEPKPNKQQQQPEKWLSFIPTYTINSDTFNEGKEYQITKDPGVFRILTIGDSFTFGQYVNTNQNWTELLETSLNSTCTKKKFEIINLGVAGYDLAYTAYRYLNRGEKYNPDLIIYLLKDDDLSEIKDITAKIKWSYLKKFENDPANESILREGTILKNKQAFAEGIKELRKQYSREEVTTYQINNLHKIIETERRFFIMNIFSYSPNVLKAIKKEVKDKKNVVFEYDALQIAEILSKEYSYLPFDAHPNVKGHILIMDRVSNYLIKNKLVPCN